MTLTQGYITKVKVTVCKWKKIVSRPLPFTGNLDGVILHTIVDHDTWVVVAEGICPVRT